MNSGLQAGRASALTMEDCERDVEEKRSAKVGESRFKIKMEKMT